MELMSPAGNLNSFISAIEAGADSVYCGYLKFNARRPADNFDTIKLKKLTKYAHDNNKKVYITLNIDLKSNELPEAIRLLMFCEEIGIDAIISKDPGLIYLLKNHFKIPYHASTQTAITSSVGAIFAQSIGFSRIVLARELAINEIKAITESINISTEIFVEGSMCFSISGRCYMSSWVGGRSGNRGACTAPCRLLWDNNKDKFTFFSMKDMQLIDKIKELSETGVDALKIEGRLKTYSWVYTITELYRSAINHISKGLTFQPNKDELKQYTARETDSGHFFSHKNRIGSNEQWDEYTKKASITLKTDIQQFYPSIKIKLIYENGIKVLINIEGEQNEIQFPDLIEAKKGRSDSIKIISDFIGTSIQDYNIEIENELIDKMASVKQIEKTAETIKSKIKLILKNQLELPALTEKLKELVSYKLNDKQRAKKIGDSPNKLIIEQSQIQFFKTNHIKEIEYINIELIKEISTTDIEALSKNYKITISLPHIIYEKDILFYKTTIDMLIKSGFKSFEANSYTGIGLLKDIDCVKTIGFGLPIYNHIAAKLFIEEGFTGVSAAFETESAVIETLSKTVECPLDVMVYSKLALFISRVDEDFFTDNKIFKDKIGTEVQCKTYGGNHYFNSTKEFCLVGKDIEKANCSADTTTADIRHIQNIQEILKKLLNKSFDKNNISTFNFFGKLV